MKFKYKISIITSIYENDLLAWKKLLMCTKKKCKWNDEEFNIAIRNSIDDSLLEHLSDDKTPESNIDKLLKTKYNERFIMQAYNELRMIKESNFYSIKNYFNRILQIMQQLKIAENWSQENQEQKFKEIFLSGLA